MSKLTFWGDFKVNSVDHLNLSGELVRILNESELNVVNFEAPIKSDEKPIKKSGPNICQSNKAPLWLEQRGFNAISLANNHAMDFGINGLKKTIEAFSRAEIMGAGTFEEAYLPHIFILADGTKVAIVCVTHREFGTLTDEWTEKDKYGCAYALSIRIQNVVADLKNSNKVDFLIVMAHAGIEYMNVPLPEWREQYRHYIDLGADAVVASHPHVPQGWETYKGKPICYSLGNFCFHSLSKKGCPPFWNYSLCCEFSIESGKLTAWRMIPISYNPKTQFISSSRNIEDELHLKKINAILCDEETYMNEVNRYVLSILPHYKGLFSRSGMIWKVFSKELLKGLLERFSIVHAFNTIACESHRWALIRALRLMKNI